MFVYNGYLVTFWSLVNVLLWFVGSNLRNAQKQSPQQKQKQKMRNEFTQGTFCWYILSTLHKENYKRRNCQLQCMGMECIVQLCLCYGNDGEAITVPD